MTFLRVCAAAWLCAAAWAADRPVTGKWNCTNLSENGTESPWTLTVREEGTKLAGLLTNGAIELPLTGMELEGSGFVFRFEINEKPYRFDGKIEGGKLEGKYSGEEAKGTLRCKKN